MQLEALSSAEWKAKVDLYLLFIVFSVFARMTVEWLSRFVSYFYCKEF